MQFTLATCVTLLLILSVRSHDIPDVTIQALKPQGLRVSLPADDKDVKFFEFHANVNKDIGEKESGDIFNRVSAPLNDKWEFTDKTVSLKKDDVLNYWVLVWKNGDTQTKHGLTQKIEGLIEQ